MSAGPRRGFRYRVCRTIPRRWPLGAPHPDTGGTPNPRCGHPNLRRRQLDALLLWDHEHGARREVQQPVRRRAEQGAAKRRSRRTTRRRSAWRRARRRPRRGPRPAWRAPPRPRSRPPRPSPLDRVRDGADGRAPRAPPGGRGTPPRPGPAARRRRRATSGSPKRFATVIAASRARSAPGRLVVPEDDAHDEPPSRPETSAGSTTPGLSDQNVLSIARQTNISTRPATKISMPITSGGPTPNQACAAVGVVRVGHVDHRLDEQPGEERRRRRRGRRRSARGSARSRSGGAGSRSRRRSPVSA